MYLVRGVGIFRDITGQRCSLKCREELAYAWVWSCVEVGRRSSIPGKRLLFCLSLGYKVVRLLSLEDTEKRPEARLLQSCGFAQIRADEQAIALLDAPLSGKPYPGCARASPGLASCCWSTADQRGCLCCLCTPWCWIFFLFPYCCRLAGRKLMAYLLSSLSSPTRERQPGLMCRILCLKVLGEMVLPTETLCSPLL